VDVEEQRARGVAGIGDVQPAAGAELPQQPAVDGAEGELAALGAAARAPGTWSSSQASLVAEK
jgi:hypothetical protein